MSRSRLHIYTEIDDERVYQIDKWGSESDDTRNEPNDWLAYINKYSTNWLDGQFVPYHPDVTDDFRKCMVKVAAIAVAAIESVDRQRETNGSTFYEDIIDRSFAPPTQSGGSIADISSATITTSDIPYNATDDGIPEDDPAKPVSSPTAVHVENEGNI